MREEEIWKDIEGYEGLYQISNMGRVKSVERTVWNKGKGCYRTVQERIMKQADNGHEYLVVGLWKDGKAKMYLVHQLVASAFCENQMGYTEVNHIDENKTNNCADNLEFCSRSYNNTYNDRAKKVGKKLSKPVIAINKRTGLILEFLSAYEAERQTGIDQSHICECCNGRRKSAGNYYWHYADTE